MRLKSITRFLMLALIVPFIFACGDNSSKKDDGGGGGGINGIPVAVIMASATEVESGTQVVLNGLSSYDPESDDPEIEDKITAYKWIQESGEAVGLVQDNVEGSIISFIAPNVNTVINVELYVTDALGVNSPPASVDIMVTVPEVIEPPKAIYVSSLYGYDDHDGDGTFERPVASIMRGIELAVEQNTDTVYVLEGKYSEEVKPVSDISIYGSVVSVDAEGNPSFSDEPISVIDAGTVGNPAVSMDEVSNVVISGFSIVGPLDTENPLTVSVSNSDSVQLVNNVISTPGKYGEDCIDLVLESSSNVGLFGNKFVGSNRCARYTAVAANNSDDITVASSDKACEFDVNYEDSLSIKSIYVMGSSRLAVDGCTFGNRDFSLSSAEEFTAIYALDAADVEITNNSIDFSGGDILSGVLIPLSTVSSNILVEENDIDLYGAKIASGVRILDDAGGNVVEVKRNRINVHGMPDGSYSKLSGILVKSSNKRNDVSLTNNIIVALAEYAHDTSEKALVKLSKLSNESVTNLMHNTLVVTGGKDAILSVLKSDIGNLDISLTNNIMFMYGANKVNSFLALPDACETNDCVPIVLNNLFNSKFYVLNLKFIGYDSGGSEALSFANECELNPSPECAGGEVIRRNNIIDQVTKLPEDYFDLDNVTVLPDFQALVIGNADPYAGIDVDVDGNARDDEPDIGATEY